MPITGEANNIQKIKLSCGKYHSPSRIEKEAQSTNIIEIMSTKNIISFLYERGMLIILLSKVGSN